MNRRYFLGILAAIIGACASKKGLDVEPEKPVPEEDGLTINGTRIFDNHNLYGVIRDSDGAPLKHVMVSDGYGFVRTDANGVYQTKANARSRFVYYSLPAGYAFAQDPSTHMPAFFRRIDPKAKANRNDFVLRKLDAPSTAFSFAVLGDIHIRDAATAELFKAGAMARIGTYFREHPSAGPAFGISLGDIINNAKDPDTYGFAREALGSAEIGSGQRLPFFTVIGNHDHNARLGDASKSGTDGFDYGTADDYMNTFGPTCYSFNVGAVHFVFLDNFISQKAPTSSSSALSGQGQRGLSDEVYNWLVKDLSYVDDKASKMVVVCEHCHNRGFDAVPHQDDLLAQISAFGTAYVFAGHAHICETYKFNVPAKGGRAIMERIHGVPMGNFWYSKYNPDSSPAGFYIYDVQGNKFSGWEFRAVDDPDDHMRVYDSQDAYDEPGDWSRQYAWSTEPLFAEGIFLLAHIYDGNEDWEVTLEHDGQSRRMTFANKRIYDYCAISHLSNDNVAGIKKTWKYHWDRSENWWYIRLDRPASELSGWKVVARAKFPESSETKTYVCDRITRKLTE